MSRKSLLRAPAVRAMLIQLSAFLLVLSFLHVFPLHSSLTIPVAAPLQGLIAAAASYIFGLAPWWLLIQAAFPVALIAMLSLHLPPAIFLGAFIALLVMYWSAFRTQVPFYPSNIAVWQAVGDLLPKGRPVRVIDIGSGLGGLVLHLAAMRRESVFAGIEIAPLPWLVSRLRGMLAHANAQFVRGDYECVDFAAYDVVFAYLSPVAMPALWRKAKSEMRPGSMLLSYEFGIVGAEPHFTIAPASGGPLLYGWRM